MREPWRRRDDTLNGPFVMHLERVCQLIARGQTFAVEFHPCSDLPAAMRGKLIRQVRLEILTDGDVALQVGNADTKLFVGLTLANYKQIWRCWQNGLPGDRLRQGTPWKARC